MMQCTRLIIKAEPAAFSIAIRAANWMLEHPDQKSAIIAYGIQPTTDFYIKRNKASISIQQLPTKVFRLLTARKR